MSPTVKAGSAARSDGPRTDVVDALLRVRSTAPEYVGSGWSGAPRADGDPEAADRERAAVTRSLSWAQERADRGEYLDALGWIAVVEQMGAELPAAFQVKRRTWGEALAAATERGDVAA